MNTPQDILTDLRLAPVSLDPEGVAETPFWERKTGEQPASIEAAVVNAVPGGMDAWHAGRSIMAGQSMQAGCKSGSLHLFACPGDSCCSTLCGL